MSTPATQFPPDTDPDLRQRHVLLADDQVISAMIVGKWLGMLGCTMERVEDGQQAVERWQQGRFDLILMDVKMPVLDGLEATARIRALEPAGSARTPIVALTAGASPQDRDSCLAAGMDTHTVKPTTLETLAAAMREALRLAASTAAAAPPQAALSEAAPGWAMDLERLRENLGHDEELLTEFIEAMQIELSLRLPRLHAARQATDARQSQEQAHALRGALGSVGAEEAVALTRALEREAGAGDWDAFGQTLARLQTQVEAIRSALAAVR